jgi:hypothetical protein
MFTCCDIFTTLNIIYFGFKELNLLNVQIITQPEKIVPCILREG